MLRLNCESLCTFMKFTRYRLFMYVVCERSIEPEGHFTVGLRYGNLVVM